MIVETLDYSVHPFFNFHWVFPKIIVKMLVIRIKNQWPRSAEQHDTRSLMNSADSSAERA